MDAKQITVKSLAFSLLGVFSLEFLLRWTLPPHPLLLLGVVRLLQASLVVLAVKLWAHGMPSLGIDLSALFPGLGRGLLWSGGFALLCGLFLSALVLLGMNPLKFLQTRLPRGSTDLFLFFLVGGVIAPITEEIFFRGLIYGFLRRWGFPAALVFSTLLFALVHPMDRRLPVTQIIGGLLFAVAYEVEGTLLVPITLHALGNLAIFSSYFLFVR